MSRKKGPGLYFRKGLSLVEAIRMFPDDDVAERWFISNRWPNGIECPHCGSSNVQEKTTHPEMHH